MLSWRTGRQRSRTYPLLRLPLPWLQHQCAKTRLRIFLPGNGLLKKVLKRNENDLEAGINMAILEIKTNRIQQANKRLAGLQETYPEDVRIAEILNQLNAYPNSGR